MKTVGEILSQARVEKKLTLNEVEAKTKIRQKYLQALEENAFEKLPSLTYTKGFIKNYAEFLGLDSQFLASVFRRQFDRIEKEKIIPSGVSHPLNEPFFRLTPAKIMAALSLFLVLLFFFWLVNQYQSLVGVPVISLERPQENEVIKAERVEIVGKTTPGATVTINGQEVKLLDGKFSQAINVAPGLVTIEIEATNKFGKKTQLRRTFMVGSP